MAAKTADKTEKEPAPKSPALEIPKQPEGKTETRLFQTTPDSKVWLTKEEAKEAGFYWKG